MSDITFDVPEGYYLSPFVANMVLSENVESLQFSVNGAPPSISKYVAYDRLNPPNPFIAVTQDGNGNVVYDGGFPKFYNSSAPAVVSRPSISMDATAVCTAVTPDDPSHAYILFSDKVVTVSIGDRLVYEMFQENGSSFVGIDAVTSVNPDELPGQYSLRDWGYPLVNAIVDQEGLPIDPSADLGGKANGKWYHREFDLSQAAGNTFIKWFVGYENGTVGTHRTRFRDIYIVDRDGEIKTTLFRNDIDVTASSIETSVHGFDSIDNVLYDPRSQFTASFKYLYNAILWTANPKKIAAGNRNILIVGDASSGASYGVRNSSSSGFFTSFTRLCNGMGYTTTFKDAPMYPGGYINETLASLETYACVLLMSSVHSATAFITDSCVQAMLTYRERGNGLIFVTDHGPIIPNVQSAYPPVNGGGFFVTANKVIVNFGAFFTGDYNRTPVNVGFLRSTYGDHPLYDGMDDSESISAGGSESRVQVAIYDSLPPTAITPFTVSSGQTNIQVTGTLYTGEIVTGKVTYNVVSFKVAFTDGQQVRDNGQVFDIGAKNQSVINVVIQGTLTQNVTGIVYKNGLRIGTMSYTQAGGVVHAWDDMGAATVKFQNGDTVTVVLSPPLSMTSGVTIKRFQPVKIRTMDNMADVMGTLRSYRPQMTDIQRVRTIFEEIASTNPTLDIKPVVNIPTNFKLMGDYFNNEGDISLNLLGTYSVDVAAFNAPGPWVGFYVGVGGVVTPNTYRGFGLRDMNSSSTDIRGPMFFQLGLLGILPSPSMIPSYITIDDLPLLSFQSRISDTSIDRLFYGDGQINIYNYISSKLGKKITVKFYR